MGSLKQVRPELSPGQVEQAVLGSSGDDWLYFPRERVFSFRRDLLIRIERVSPEVARIFYGAVPVGDAAVAEQHHGDTVDVMFRGHAGKALLTLKSVPVVRQAEDDEPLGVMGFYSEFRAASGF